MPCDPLAPLILDAPDAAARLGAAIARALRKGEAVCLSGPLGAGKSTLARGLIRALTSPDEDVPSPTFTLVQTYEGPAFAIAHFDLYRLKAPEEAQELGLDEALEQGAAVIEWPERLEGALPAHRLDVSLEIPPDQGAPADPSTTDPSTPDPSTTDPPPPGAALRDSRAMAHGTAVTAIFSDPRSLEPPADLSNREAVRLAFLARHGLGEAVREPLAGDASTRAYARLIAPGRPALILMDAPPAAESAPAPPDASPAVRLARGYNAIARLAAGRVDAFAGAAAWLRAQGLSAPRIEALDVEAGLAVLEDLGDDLFVRRIAAGEPARPLYEAAVDVVARLHAVEPPTILPFDVAGAGGAWALPTYDALALRLGGDLFLDWWPRLTGMAAPAPEALEAWSQAWAPIQAAGEQGADVFVHRDFHAENLLWLPQRSGAARVGLLDFQDAVRGHRAWDLLHLLQDARRDVAPELEAAMLDRYLAACPQVERERFLADYAGLAALNAARILGPVFARQIVLFGREKYRAFLPRTWRALERNLQHPALAELRDWFDRWVPPEARA